MSKGMVISFLMSGCGSKGPMGGYKVVYEYANRLVADGYNVNILYPITLNFSKQKLINKIRLFPRILKWLVNGVSCRGWFNLDYRVRERVVLSLSQRHVPNSDVYVATALQTSYYLNNYQIEDNSRLYLIQDFENWGISDTEVFESYRFGLKNITVSSWLSRKVEEAGAKSVLIKNGFDFNYFKLTNPIENRDPLSVAMLYHNDERKGCKYGIKALEIVKKNYPDLKANFFGVPSRPKDLPDWIEYYQTPDRETHNKIYNQAAIYIAPSLQEGWGLTVGEAMICGASIVCTNTLGFLEMIRNRENGIIVPVADELSLANAMLYLIENQSIRIKLARQGYEDIHKFSWDNSYQKFKGLLPD